MEVAMDFKQTFQAALNAGVEHEALLQLVQRYQAQGLSQEESYRVLEQIWREHGFDESENEGTMRADLEFVMEKVWYQGAR